MGESEVLRVNGGMAGERPAQATPLPNRTDATFAELDALRAEADVPGLAPGVIDHLSLVQMRELVERAKAGRAD